MSMTKRFGILVIALAILLVGSAMAAYLPPETPETTSIVSTKAIVCNGAVFEGTDASLDTTGNGVTSLGAYSSRMMTNGFTDYGRMITVDSGNQNEVGYNIDVLTAYEFEGTGMAFREGLAEIGTSAGSSKETCGERESMCVFESEPGCSEDVYPPFCNSAVVKTTLMGESIGFESIGSVRSIAENFDVPANLEYGINAEGTGSIRVIATVFDLEARNLGTKTTEYIPSEYTPSELIPSKYKPSKYTPSEYTPESISIVKCKPVFNPSQYTPEEYTASKYKPGKYTPSEYTPEQFVTVGNDPVPDGITRYKEVSTAVGTFTFDQYFSYTSGIHR